jgi:hypothetical protein
MKRVFSNTSTDSQTSEFSTSGEGTILKDQNLGWTVSALSMSRLACLALWSISRQLWVPSKNRAVGVVVLILALTLTGCAGHLRGTLSGGGGNGIGPGTTDRMGTSAWSLEINVDLQQSSTLVKRESESWWKRLQEIFSKTSRGSDGPNSGVQNRGR